MRPPDKGSMVEFVEQTRNFGVRLEGTPSVDYGVEQR